MWEKTEVQIFKEINFQKHFSQHLPNIFEGGWGQVRLVHSEEFVGCLEFEKNITAAITTAQGKRRRF